MTKGSKYKNIHGIILNGVKICMSDKKHKYFDIPKLIINGIGSYNYTLYDKNGEYGMSEKAVGIINPSANTLQFIQSPLFHFIANSTKIIGNNFNIKTSLFLPIIPQDIKIKDVADLYNYFGFTTDEISKINNFSIPTYKDQFLSCDGKTLLNGNQIKNQPTNEVVEEDQNEDVEELIPATEATEDIPIAISSPIPKKKRTIKKRQKLIIVESSVENTLVPENAIDPNAEKIFNPLTNRHVKNTPANRKKIEQQTLKRGGKGKSKKKTRKNKGK